MFFCFSSAKLEIKNKITIGKITYFFTFFFKIAPKKGLFKAKTKKGRPKGRPSPSVLKKHYSFTSVSAAGASTGASTGASALGVAFLALLRVLLALAGF